MHNKPLLEHAGEKVSVALSGYPCFQDGAATPQMLLLFQVVKSVADVHEIEVD
jgi:hypothetical protein